MAEIIEEELFSDPLSKAGLTGSLTTAPQEIGGIPRWYHF
jgi:hypothetical protein